MIIDNSFIVPWLSYLDFQNTINNKARFLIFFINILNVQVSIMLFVICLILFFLFFIIHVFVFKEFPWGFEVLDQKILLVLSFSQKKFLKFIFTHFVLIGWNSLPPTSFSKPKIQSLYKFIYFYFLMFSDLGYS